MTMNRYFNIIILMMGVMCMSPVYAQTTIGARNYACDFEVDSINAKWVNNPGIYAPQIPNKWFIGDAVNNGGYSSLYISTDSARTAGYTNSSSLAVSYTTITLKEGYYDLAFDWMAMGYVAESEDKNNPTDPGEVALYVCWVPELNEFGESINITAQANNALPKYVQDYALSFDDVNYLCGNAQWRTQVTRIYGMELQCV